MKYKITIEKILEDLYELDTEFGEALAHGLMEMKYVSDSPLNLSMGTKEQQKELKKVYSMSLNSKQIREIINYISNDRKTDFQYGAYLPIAKKYLEIADAMEKGKSISSILKKFDKYNLVEIYDIKTNVVIIQFVARRTPETIKQAVHAMEKFGFKLTVGGKMTSEEIQMYWIASNKDYSNLHLQYREKLVDKKDLTFDKDGYSYTCLHKDLNWKHKNKEPER